MKIAFVYDAVHPWIKGGTEKRIYEIGRRLVKKHEVHFGIGWWFSEKSEETAQQLSVNGISMLLSGQFQ